MKYSHIAELADHLPRLRVLLYKDAEEGEWVALCLEMNIHGWGATWNEALNVLEERIEAHVSFACENDRTEAIFCSAGPEWLARWEEGLPALVRRGAQKPKVEPTGFNLLMFPFPRIQEAQGAPEPGPATACG